MAAGDGIRDRWEARRGGIGSSVAAIPRDPREIARWAGRWLIVIAAGWLLDLAGMPVAWLIGPMIAAVVLALRGTPPGPNPQPVFTGVQAVIGMASRSPHRSRLTPSRRWPTTGR
jgi:hypothetical protein